MCLGRGGGGQGGIWAGRKPLTLVLRFSSPPTNLTMPEHIYATYNDVRRFNVVLRLSPTNLTLYHRCTRLSGQRQPRSTKSSSQTCSSRLVRSNLSSAKPTTDLTNLGHRWRVCMCACLVGGSLTKRHSGFFPARVLVSAHVRLMCVAQDQKCSFYLTGAEDVPQRPGEQA